VTGKLEPRCGNKTARPLRTPIAALGLATLCCHASALNILLSNDDGLSSNVKALHGALKAAGHDVVVSIPCQNQSGKGASINYLTPLITLAKACRNGAAAAGAPAVGPVSGLADFYYVDGTPVMATLYGLDVLAAARWGKAPDLVLSGPNEGQNTGTLVNGSGTVSNDRQRRPRGRGGTAHTQARCRAAGKGQWLCAAADWCRVERQLPEVRSGRIEQSVLGLRPPRHL
jgi:broad specificity polyphosphatase/5'/3'-nucleotidase SurE